MDQRRYTNKLHRHNSKTLIAVITVVRLMSTPYADKRHVSLVYCVSVIAATRCCWGQDIFAFGDSYIGETLEACHHTIRKPGPLLIRHQVSAGPSLFAALDWYKGTLS